MPKAATKKPASEAFIPSHTSTYGVKVMDTCPTTHRVLSVRCQFCIYFGVEIDPTKIRKRGPKTTTMAWIGSFRCDKYTEHHDRLHPARWAIYKACSSAEKTRFFDDVTPLANTMLPHVNVGSAATFKFDIRLPIVDCFIGDMFFHPDDQGGITQKRALKSFKRVDDHYEVVIPNRDEFRLVVKNLSGGMSFRQLSVSMTISRRFWVLHSNCDSFLIRTGVSRIGNLTDMKVASYARIVLARSLQLITTILDPQKNRSAWAFSLANDASTHYGRSYLDNRIRVHVDGKLHNFHLVAIPMYEAHRREHVSPRRAHS